MSAQQPSYLSCCKHLAYSNKATFKVEHAKQIYSLLLKEQVGRYAEDLKHTQKFIMIGLVYNLKDHRYEVISVIYDTENIHHLNIDTENILQNEPFKPTEEQVLVFSELLDDGYIRMFDRELSLLKFYEMNAKGAQEFPIAPIDVIVNVMKCHFDIEMEDTIRKDQRFTNAVSIEMTHNEKMKEIVSKLNQRLIPCLMAKNSTAEIYQDELLALIYDMLDQIDRVAMANY